MSILIKGMKMPDSCFHCKLAEVCQYYKAEHYANKRHEDCPLEEVPETHDKRTETHACDLISRQALCEYALNQKDKSVTPNDIMRFPSADLQLTCNQLATDSNTHKALDALDCISRQAAIDACIRVREYRAYDEIEEIKALPSAQPELIRCKDCKHTYLSDNFGITSPWLMCKGHIGNVYKVEEDDYCSRAERRTDE